MLIFQALLSVLAVFFNASDLESLAYTHFMYNILFLKADKSGLQNEVFLTRIKMQSKFIYTYVYNNL